MDKPFFQVFSFPLLMGNPSSVFAQDYSMVLTENHARKYFGDANPIGKTLTLISGQDRNDFLITGIVSQPAPNSTITFDILIDMESARALNMEKMWRDNWGAFEWQNYVLVNDKNSVESILRKFPSFTKLYYGPIIEESRQRNDWKGEGLPYSFGLQEITRVHLDPRVKGSPNMSAILILSGIAFIVLLIACINFMNLSIGRASTRSLEVGMRKVLGASVPQIINILIREFIWLVGIANIISWPLAYFAMKMLLDNYYYRIPLGPLYFLLAGILSFIIAALTTIFLAVRAAVANPVDSLWYE